jgi:hypothetical protein
MPLMALLLCGALLLGLASEELLTDARATVGVGIATFMAGLSFALFWRGDEMQASALLGYGLGAVVTAGTGVVLTLEIGAGRAIVLLALGAGAVIALLAAIRRIGETGEPVGIESDWGGLGQGLGGWRISPSAALMVVALLFGGMAAGVATTAPAETIPAGKNQRSKEEIITIKTKTARPDMARPYASKRDI